MIIAIYSKNDILITQLRLTLAQLYYLIKKNLIHSPLPEINETYLQATSMLVSLNKYTKLTLSSTYCPPGPEISMNNFKNYFE